MTDSAAIWSSVAATFSAVAAFLLWSTEKKSFRHSIRPELVLSGWRRFQDKDRPDEDLFAFTTITNVGRGPALHVYINSSLVGEDNCPRVFMSTLRHAILAPGDHVQVDGTMSILWKNIPTKYAGAKTVPISIDALCWDTTGVRYRTQYRLLAMEMSSLAMFSDSVAPGVSLAVRVVTHTSVWRLKLIRWCARVPRLRTWLSPKGL
jgi:hypothetical protein